MSNWLAKSNVSFKYAKNGQPPLFNNIRVHCHYYGCIQLMFHILYDKMEMSVKEIDDKSNRNKNGGQSVHSWLSHYFHSKLFDNYRLDALDLNNNLGKLKKLRTDADYALDSITDTSLTFAVNQSGIVKRILNKHYIINNEQSEEVPS